MGSSMGLGFEVVLAIYSYSGPGRLQKPGRLPQTAFSKNSTALGFMACTASDMSADVVLLRT
jgi:hypothetical protein